MVEETFLSLPVPDVLVTSGKYGPKSVPGTDGKNACTPSFTEVLGYFYRLINKTIFKSLLVLECFHVF